MSRETKEQKRKILDVLVKLEGKKILFCYAKEKRWVGPGDTFCSEELSEEIYFVEKIGVYIQPCTKHLDGFKASHLWRVL